MPSLRKLATLAAVLALALTAPSAQASGNGGVLNFHSTTILSKHAA